MLVAGGGLGGVAAALAATAHGLEVVMSEPTDWIGGQLTSQAALVPVRLENLIAGGKAIGTTHITNGAYRLHPTEWNAGEATGHLAALCSQRRVPPRAVRDRPALLDSFQRALDAAGIEREWPR